VSHDRQVLTLTNKYEIKQLSSHDDYVFVNIMPHSSHSNGGVPFLESTMLGHNIILFNTHPLHPFVRFLARYIESLNLKNCPGFGVFITSLGPFLLHSLVDFL
jgi:hypothetical protein